MSIIQRIIGPGVEVSAHTMEPGRGGVGIVTNRVRIDGTSFAVSDREAINIGEVVMRASNDGMISYIAVWMDHEVEGSCQIFQPVPVVFDQGVIIPAGQLRLRFS